MALAIGWTNNTKNFTSTPDSQNNGHNGNNNHTSNEINICFKLLVDFI